MKYDFVFKLNCLELYRNGQWFETPEGIGQKNFRKRIGGIFLKIKNGLQFSSVEYIKIFIIF